MKKSMLLAFVICLCLLSLFSCTTIYEVLTHPDQIIDIRDGFEYSGNFYRYFKPESNNKYYKFYDCTHTKHSGEVVGHFISMYGSLGDVSKSCEVDFGDAVLKISCPPSISDMYIKDGFSFPDYKSLSIKSVYLSKKEMVDVTYETEIQLNEELRKVADYSESQQVVLKDFVDFYNYIQYNGYINEQKNFDFIADIAFTLKDYSTIYCGFYSIYKFEEKLYIEIDDSKKLYQIKEECLNIFD